MIEALHAILTNSKMRSAQMVKVALIKNSSVGTPWLGKDVVKANP